MQNSSANGSDHYDELVARQVDQYKETEIMHDLPGIYDYWSGRHISDNSARVTGHADIVELYATYFQKSLHESSSRFLISVGSGDCSIEIQVVKSLIAKGEKDFFFICLELSPILIEKARKQIDTESLGDIITVAQIDLNKWAPKYSFAGVMAHHSLHHILELEHLFELIKKHLAPDGRFITCDIIGRNGHMRWPESLLLVRKIWEKIPRKYKYNHQFRRFDDYFENWDCSVEGFEGIRAQDILPILVRLFNFEVFYGCGNLIDPFVDRGFGPNYSPANPDDRSFIDAVQTLNETLISDGVLKPTIMTAVMVNEPVSDTKMYKHWSPAFSVRNPESPAPGYDLNALLKNIPNKATREDDPLIAKQVGYFPFDKKTLFTRSKNIVFKKAAPGLPFLTYGWGYPESQGVWSIGEAAALTLPLQKKIDTDIILTLELLPYQSPLFAESRVDILVNDISTDVLHFDNKSENAIAEKNIRIPLANIRDQQVINITFLLPNRRQPQFESGKDLRTQGIMLISVKIAAA
jgi:SAM-dependent methyltransferase